jgi:hypothetical protein
MHRYRFKKQLKPVVEVLPDIARAELRIIIPKHALSQLEHHK